MNSHKQVTAVVVTYQSRDIVDQVLEPLGPAVQAGLADCVVVDNASGDGTADFVESRYAWAKTVRSPKNIGFGRGCNLGFQSVATPYVLFINPDASIEFAELRTLVEFMEAHPRAAIAGPATYGPNSPDPQSVGMVLTPLGLIRTAFRLPGAYPDRRILRSGDVPYRTSWVCGAVMLIRSDMFRQLGGFDPRFFLYFEETDLCLRAAHERMEIWAVGDATATHTGGVSARKTTAQLTGSGSANITEHFYTSRYYYLVKHYGRAAAVVAESVSCGMEWLRWTLKRLTGREAAAAGAIAARPFLRMPAELDD